MKKSIKLSIFLILVLAIALSVFGCAKKTPGKAKKPGKQTEQKESEKKMTDEEIESLFEMEAIDEEEYMVKSYKGALTDVKIPSEYKGKKVTFIGRGAFYDNSSIESVNIPSSISMIGPNAFEKCIGLKNVTLSEGLTSIRDFAFLGTRIESIVIPSTVKSIKDGVFGECKRLKKITLKEGLNEIARRAFIRTAIESISIPKTVESIGNNAFYECSDLKSVALNEGLKTIEKNAFSYSGVETITIPSTVENVGEYAFAYCSQLTKITCKVKSKPDGWDSNWSRNCSGEIVWG